MPVPLGEHGVRRVSERGGVGVDPDHSAAVRPFDPARVAARVRGDDGQSGRQGLHDDHACDLLVCRVDQHVGGMEEFGDVVTAG